MVKQVNGEQSHPAGCSEAMSRLIDGELDASGCRELFLRLDADAEARRNWVLLNIACDALRSSETAALHSAGFVSRVSAALDAEPVILAPGAMRRRHGVLRRVVVPAAAVAAAAAVLAVVAVPQLRAPGTDSKMLEAKLERKVAPPQTEATTPGVTRSAELEAYLAAHRESATGPVTSRVNEYVTPAALTTESR